jgi:ADP-ribose pyrophosphatase
MKIRDVVIDDVDLWGDGGFARLRRCRAYNVRDDDSRSAHYTLDLVERPVGTDAVAVLPYERCGASTRILLRRGLRPAPRLARAGEPTREGDLPSLMHLELVAGVLELEDLRPGGLRHRASLELLEEVGLRVAPDQIEPLGPPVFLSPGLSAERIYYCCVEAPLGGPLEQCLGDGSLLEEGGEGVLYDDLEQALAACRAGEIMDAKTELGLRRLGERLLELP